MANGSDELLYYIMWLVKSGFLIVMFLRVQFVMLYRLYHACFIAVSESVESPEHLEGGSSDVEGWETVRRSRSKTSPTSKGSTSSKSSVTSNGAGKFHKTASRSGTTNSASRNSKKHANPPLSKAVKPPKGADKPASLSKSLENIGGSYRDAVVKASSEQTLG